VQKQRNLEPRAALSLSETHVGNMQFLPVEESHAGRGCLLQIYPASVDVDMIRLGFGNTLIGRDSSSEVVLDDNAVSRHHAVIESHQDGYSLRDLDSTNGTFIDDTPVTEVRPLEGGELIRVGGTILKFMSSIDEEVQYHAVVRELMTRDALTSAYNRSYLIPMLRKSIERSAHSGEPVALIMMDIDHFKSINDRHGHVVGDEVLRVFSERIRGGLLRDEILARLGGEEFLIVAENTGVERASAIAETLRMELDSNLFQTQAGEIKVTCSFGVASTEAVHPETIDQFLSAVDTALYSAKNQGRNRVVRNT
jgi:diguanylate cyclase (GGDEF)-like protein